MKILLTAKPGAGKSTVLMRVREGFHGPTYGVITHEIRDDAHHRQGFQSVSMTGEKRVIAHRSLIQSTRVVGGEFHVDVDAIDGFAAVEIEKGLGDLTALVFVDEIGRMQAFSSRFMEVSLHALDAPSAILGTLVYEAEEWSLPFRQHPEVILVEVTRENREALPGLLLEVYAGRALHDALPAAQRPVVRAMLRRYLQQAQAIQVGKIFRHALPYVLGKQVELAERGINQAIYHIHGLHGDHETRVTLAERVFQCDCDLFNGRGIYRGQPGECSHIQAIRILRGWSWIGM